MDQQQQQQQPTTTEELTFEEWLNENPQPEAPQGEDYFDEQITATYKHEMKIWLHTGKTIKAKEEYNEKLEIEKQSLRNNIKEMYKDEEKYTREILLEEIIALKMKKPLKEWEKKNNPLWLRKAPEKKEEEKPKATKGKKANKPSSKTKEGCLSSFEEGKCGVRIWTKKGEDIACGGCIGSNGFVCDKCNRWYREKKRFWQNGHCEVWGEGSIWVNGTSRSNQQYMKTGLGRYISEGPFEDTRSEEFKAKYPIEFEEEEEFGSSSDEE